MSVLAFVRVLNAVKSVLSPSSEQRSSKRSKRQNNVRNVSQRVLFTAFSTSTSTLIRWYILGMEWDEKSHQKTQQWIAKSQCFNFKAPSFIWKRKHFVAFSCPVHIKPMKTQTFENALHSGKIWKRNSIGFGTGRKRNSINVKGRIQSPSLEQEDRLFSHIWCTSTLPSLVGFFVSCSSGCYRRRVAHFQIFGRETEISQREKKAKQSISRC